ncbi:MAG: translesion DNA synthesis-associated protein ImuA [bacterium]
MSLQTVLQHAGIWRGRDHGIHRSQAKTTEQGIPTGYKVLDENLPAGGWPPGALTEILHQHTGQGELQLLIPAIRHLTENKHYVVMIDPPWQPNAPALSEAGIQLPYLIIIGPLSADDKLWSIEQSLRAGYCAAVLAWPGNQKNLSNKALRRLQLAAESGKSSGFLFRAAESASEHSPAALRIQFQADSQPQKLHIIKCRGRYFSRPLELPQPSGSQRHLQPAPQVHALYAAAQ